MLRRTVAIGGGISFAIWIVAALGSRLLVEIVAGHAFIAAAEPFRWYLLAMVIQIAAAPIMRAMIALGRPGTLFLFDCATLVLLVSAVTLGALKLGLLGVAVAIVVHKLAQLTLSATWVSRHVRRLEREQRTQTASIDVDVMQSSS